MASVPPMSAAIRAVFDQSRAELDRRVETVEDAIASLIGGHLEEELRAGAARDAHKLAGTLGMFGLSGGSESARELETALTLPGGPAPANAPRLAEAVLELREQLASADVVPAESAGAVEDGERQAHDRTLLIVSPDPELTERLRVEALGQGICPQTTPTCAGARRLLVTEVPDAAVLDVTFGVPNSDGLDLLEELTGRDPPVPALVLTSSDALVDRVEVARRGGSGFVTRTHTASQVISTVAEQIQRARGGGEKILAVDDDPAISAVVSGLLGEHALAVTTLSDLLKFWESLESSDPDLLILDLDMPGLNGIDLCRAVRTDIRFGELPIVFLTASTSAGCIQEIFDAGADDYVAKPIVGQEFASRVLNRLNRVRLYRDLAERDALTGLTSRRYATRAIDRMLSRADQLGQPLSLARIELDEFRRLNDVFGRSRGDAALRRLAGLATETFTGGDVIGRLDSAELVVATFGMTCDGAVQRVAELLEAYRDEQFASPDGRMAQISFSAGVAEYPRDGSDGQTLERAACDALLRAKTGGGDRVVPADSQSSTVLQELDVLVVEDDAVLAGLLVDSLETRGYRTSWLGDGQEAVAALTGPQPNLSPRLVLLDVDLPSLDGLSVLGLLAEDGTLDRARVILLTAHAGEREVVAGLELGAFDHVAKPFSMPVLMQRVRGAMTR